jgi:hypothetical protein
MTMTLISAQTVGSGGAADITFSSIPQTYTDLRLYMSTRVTNNGEGSNPPISRGEVTFNTNGTNYSIAMLYALPNQSPTQNAAVGANATRSFYFGASTSALASHAGAFSSSNVYIQDYTSSKFKTYSIESVIETNSLSGELDITSGCWNNSAAITSIKVNPYDLTASFAQYSTMYLYGISKS